MARRSLKKEFPSANSVHISEGEIPHVPGSSHDNSSSLSEIPDEPDLEMIDINYPQQTEPMSVKAQRKKVQNPAPSAARFNSPETVSAASDKGLEILGRGVKELVQAVQKLRHLGIEDLVLPLPKIVVIGDQSTGKSSLIEGMSEIKVPRDVGTCTRCPLEINISESLDERVGWSCKISLHKRYTYEGKHVEGRPGKGARGEGASRHRPLGPWTVQDREDYHFATLRSKEQVPYALRLAQLATLNPGSPPDIFLPGRVDPGEKRQVQFSPNVVQLEISGPGLPNLSFYDLPGVINVSEVAEDEYLVDLVKNLVKEYIKDESCINILAISMTDDPANSTAFDLVRKVKAEARTVGVLTKPDRVQQSESFEQWIDVLSGRKFKLGFGYYVIKNNPDTEVDHATARQEEREFFQDSPWATELSQYAARFGTLQLQTALSHKLTAQIRASLPRIIDQVHLKSAKIDTELMKLPEIPTGNLPMKVLEKILEFDGAIRRQIEGGSQEYPFQKEWNQLAMKFRGVLAESEPILEMSDLYPSSIAYANTEDRFESPLAVRPRHSPASRLNAPTAYIAIDDDDEDMIESPLNNKRRRGTPAQSTPRKKPAAAVKPVAQRPPIFQIPAFEASTGADCDRPFARRFSLYEVRNIIEDAHIGLPGQTDPRAVDKIIQISMQDWDQPLCEFMAQTEELCFGMVRSLADTTFALWQKTRLHEKLHIICETFVRDTMNVQKQAAERARLLELHKPMTFNKEAVELAYAKGRTKTQKGRLYYRAKHYVEQHMKDSNQGQTLDEKITKVIDAKRLGPDEYGKEVEIMGTVKGYYEYAFSRFVDVIGLSIQGELFVACRNDIGKVMKDEIGLTESDANDRCADLLEVDAENRERRDQLKKEKGRIQEAQSWLEGLSRDDPN